MQEAPWLAVTLCSLHVQRASGVRPCRLPVIIRQCCIVRHARLPLWLHGPGWSPRVSQGVAPDLRQPHYSRQDRGKEQRETGKPEVLWVCIVVHTRKGAWQNMVAVAATWGKSQVESIIPWRAV